MTLDQLINAYKAVHDGIAPDTATQARLQYFVQLSEHQPADAAAMSYIVNSADSTTALAVLSYQFFTGKSPTAAGLDFLVNSQVNTNDLNDEYYRKFNIENRYINFAANLGVQGEGALVFANKYGAMSFGDYVASIYQTIIGANYAAAAGIDPAKAIADIIARKDSLLATATSAGMITSGMTTAQVDLALKAATAGYLLGEAVKADVGLYASAANNFMVAVATGTATYNTDITKVYASPANLTGGSGQAVSPGFNFPPPVVTEPTTPAPVSHAFTLTTGVDTFTGESLADTFTGKIGTGATFGATDVLNGGDGADSLVLDSDTATFSLDPTKITNIEVLRVKAQTQALNINVGGIAFTEVNNNGSNQAITFDNIAPTSTLSINNTSAATTFMTPNAGLSGNADAITLKLDGVAVGTVVTITADVARANEYETLNIVSNGSGGGIVLTTNNTQTSLSTINISGSGNTALQFSSSGGDHTAQYATTIDAHTLSGRFQLVAGTAANTIKGGTGVDWLQLGVQGVNAQSGADVISTGTGNDIIRFVGNIAAGTGGSGNLNAFANVTDFDINNDKLAFSANDSDFSLRPDSGNGAARLGLSKVIAGQTGGDLGAGDAISVQTLAQNVAGGNAAVGTNFIKLTTAVAFNTDVSTTFADAFGTGILLHLGSERNYLVSVYDTTHAQMIVAVVNVGSNAAADDNLDAADFNNSGTGVAVVGVVNMSASDYAAFGASNLGLF